MAPKKPIPLLTEKIYGKQLWRTPVAPPFQPRVDRNEILKGDAYSGIAHKNELQTIK